MSNLEEDWKARNVIVDKIIDLLDKEGLTVYESITTLDRTKTVIDSRTQEIKLSDIKKTDS